MAFLTVDSQNQYIDHGLNNTCGGIEVAREPQRLEEFKRRMTSAKAWGIDARLVTPAEIKEMVPFINEEILLGGYYTPSVSVVDSLATGTRMREEAVAAGVLQVFANTEVLDLETERHARRLPKVSAVVTDKGRIEAEHVVDRLRRVEPAHRRDGRRQHPAHAGRAPDGRRRPDRHPRRRATRNSPTRSSATWTRSATSASRPARWRWAATPTARS